MDLDRSVKVGPVQWDSVAEDTGFEPVRALTQHAFQVDLCPFTSGFALRNVLKLALVAGK